MNRVADRGARLTPAGSTVFGLWRSIRTIFLAAAITLSATRAAASAQDSPSGGQETLLILHTNDLHDHVRPDYDGAGGLPFVAGFIQDVRSRRNDVLVLDAGDVAEKGDLVARKTGSEMVFSALSRIGYHAWAPGNHDHDFGVDALRTFTELAGTDILCINLFNGNGDLEFPASKIYEIDGVRVGVIGAIQPRDTLSLDIAGTARAMASEASRLKPDTDIIVAVVHMSTASSAEISEAATDIDVFVSGHSHEAIAQAIQVPSTGALIVQSGSYAENVGWLELTLDLEDRRVVDHETKLVAMDHKTIAPDLEMLEWVRRREVDLAPEALEVVGWASRKISPLEVGYMAAEAIRLARNADIGFNHTEALIRDELPVGLLDHNAVYRTGGERGLQLVEVELTGQEVTNYLQLLKTSDQYLTQWSGFRATIEQGAISTSLDPHSVYHAVMPQREWETRFLRFFERLAAEPGRWAGVSTLDRPISATPIDLTWTDAVLLLLENWNAAGITITDGIRAITIETGQEGFPVTPSASAPLRMGRRPASLRRFALRVAPELGPRESGPVRSKGRRAFRRTPSRSPPCVGYRRASDGVGDRSSPGRRAVGCVHLPALWFAALPGRAQVRQRHWLAELCGALRRGSFARTARLERRHGAYGASLRPLRQPPRPRVPRRAATDGPALLHQFRVAGLHSRRGSAARQARARCPRGRTLASTIARPKGWRDRRGR